MIAFLLALLMMLVIIMGVFGFITWAIREHLTARKYRYLIKLHNEMPAPVCNKGGPQWRVTYKEKEKLKTVDVSGNSEGEALKNFSRDHSVGYGNIVSCEKS